MRSFIIKSAPSNEMFRKYALVVDLFNREIFMYNTVLYEFEKFQKETKITDPFQSYPMYYGCCLVNMNEAVFLNDVTEQEYELYNRRRYLDYNHTVLVLEEYAKLHAISFAMRLQKNEVFIKLADKVQDHYFTKLEDSILNLNWKHIQNALIFIDPNAQNGLYEKLKNLVNVIKNLLKKRESNNSYSVIRHGDCWISNYLFKYESSEQHRTPSNVCILDWQASHYGSPALDLSHFIFTCTDKELRDEYYESFIEKYYQTFANFLMKMRGNPRNQFPFEILQEHLKTYSVFGLYMALQCLLISSSNGGNFKEKCEISSFEDLIEKTNHNRDNLERYGKGIKDVIMTLKIGIRFLTFY
ncbi:hypothetical protein FQR65_LT02292 [Abscondita terminalis]|nr:hypothetical protein FQR65_LT02292 [Abscondita terminalis]